MSFFWSVLKYILIGLSPWLVSITFWFVYYYIKGYRFKKGEYQYVKYGSKLKRMFIDFPRQFVLDRYELDPDAFREYGVHVICGEQGAGKSITLTFMLLRFQKMYPKLKVKTNYGYKHEDFPIQHWKDVVASTNGIYGEIDVLDEIQNWFNSLQSKDFPPEMMTEITQQRKQRKMILGTSQVFSRISKPIREQITYLYEPLTMFGCMTVVKKYKPNVDGSDGQVKEKKLKGCFFFVHSKELRESFDTYRKVELMAKEGFKSEQEQLHSDDI